MKGTITIDKFPFSYECPTQDCKNILIRFISRSIVEIKGTCGIFEIDFSPLATIRVSCLKCKKEIILTSDLIDFKPKSINEFSAAFYIDKLKSVKLFSPKRGFFELNKYQRDLLLKELNDKQKKIYELLLEANSDPELMMANTGLNKENFEKNLEKIIKEIERIANKNFCVDNNT